MDNIKKENLIEALGNLLAYYNSDLTYIFNFSKYKKERLSNSEFLDGDHGFQQFINEYRIARNVRKEKVKKLMIATREWCLNKNELDVGGFARKLKQRKITQKGKMMVSLASKLLFLNNPIRVTPIDSFTKKAVGIRENNYAEFRKKVMAFQKENKNVIEKYISKVDPMLRVIEKHRKGLSIDFKKYRLNRYTDKLLWVIGKE